MIDIEDALLMRAEFCGGFCEPPTDADYDGAFRPMINSIVEIIGRCTEYCANAEFAMWQSLLTREVLISGGL